MTAEARTFTADELLRLPDDGRRYELVRGELRKMSPAGGRHGQIAYRIGLRLGLYVEQHRLGVLYSSDTGFLLSRNPDTVRMPDVSFVRMERFVDTPDLVPGAPDLAVEVISPSDSYSEVIDKTREYLRAGTQAVIVVDPRTQTAEVHRASGTTPVTDVLALDDIVPGWRLPLAEVFAA